MTLAVQLYTLRSAFELDVPGTLAALAEMGLRHVELAGTYGRSAKELRHLLDDVGLTAIGMHVGLEALGDTLLQTLEDGHALGCRHLVLPWIAAEEIADGWAGVGMRLEPIGAAVLQAGMVFSYHNHAFELVDDGGRTGLESLFASCDAALVQAEIDVAWVHHAGHDPAAMIRNLAGRVPLVHLKDFTDDPESLDIEAGKGVLDWDSILEACRVAGVEYGVIELDNPPQAPLDSVRECYDFFVGKGLTP